MNEPKVSGLCGYGLEVPELAVAQRFYQTFGLQVRSSGSALLLACPGRGDAEIVVTTAREKRLHHVSFFIAPGTESAFADKLRRAGLDVAESAPPGGARDGLWFRDPWGTWINLNPAPASAVQVVELPASNLGGRTERVDVNLWQKLDKQRPPMRIGHLLIFTHEWEKAEAFFTGVLGLRTTDRAKGKVAFMAAGEGVIDHHCFGLINGTHRGFQHASFQVASFDDLGYGAWRMRAAGYRDAFGPGRHAIASNLFHYTRDPWGSWVEYYADMDKISERWHCRDWESLPYTWGPEWSPEFWSGEMNANLEPRS
ncbi:MAG: VOC family protein [Proteobacteria bacterium]|nr:VOC family protein [Pseudomonadota bacterium]